MFRKYDIRGVVGEEITEQLFYDICRAFSSYARQNGHKKILLGHDNRSSSPLFRDIAIKAAQATGCDVVSLGEVVTPLFYFAAHHLDIKAGIMITASHNPKEYNGLKLFLDDSTIYGEQIQHLYRLVIEQDFITGESNRIENIDIFPIYAQMISEKITMGNNKQKVVIDCGNGTASLFAPEIFRLLGCEVVELYCDSDPNFPNHHPDPVNPNNMQDLIKEV
ncbi:MAG: phosphomannomutase, partial [Syntrophomonadaceae bacterium]|nr:phosphomannomutase [Syntrophomonadaceae bacterium]